MSLGCELIPAAAILLMGHEGRLLGLRLELQSSCKYELTNILLSLAKARKANWGVGRGDFRQKHQELSEISLPKSAMLEQLLLNEIIVCGGNPA